MDFRRNALRLVLIVSIVATLSIASFVLSNPNGNLLTVDPNVNLTPQKKYFEGQTQNGNETWAGIWHFDEGSGGTTADSGIYSNDGTINGASWTTGVHDDALYFNQSEGDYVDVADTDSLDLTDEIYISVWVNHSIAPSSGGTIVVKRDSSDIWKSPYHLYYTATSSLYFRVYNGSSAWWAHVTSFVANLYHIEVLYKPLTYCKIYWNGSNVYNEVPTLEHPLATTGSSLRIGNGYYPFNGTIDELYISNSIQDGVKITGLRENQHVKLFRSNLTMQATMGVGETEVILEPSWSVTNTRTYFPDTFTLHIFESSKGKFVVPPQSLTLWKNDVYQIRQGGRATFVTRETLQLNKITFNKDDGRLILRKDGVNYWINVTSGENARIGIYKWFQDAGCKFSFETTGTFEARLYVASKGAPTHVTGCDSWNCSGSYVDFTVTCSSTQIVTIYWIVGLYTLHGLFNETTGTLIPSGVNVTAYFTDGSRPETFFLNGTYEYGHASSRPQYFRFELGEKDREYWLGENEDNAIIYILDDELTSYVFDFIDLAGTLDKHPYVEIKYWINGTLRTVEKRKVDVEKKASFSLVNGRKYMVIIQDSISYTFGELLMTSDISVTLTLEGIEFPRETLLTYKYVRIYATRKLGSPTGNITFTYEDTLNQTNSVEIYINYKNGTNAYNATETADSFIHTWTSAENDTDYRAEVIIDHGKYGVYTWRQYFPRSMSEAPWGLDWLGSLLFDTSLIIPAAIILVVAGCFSVINAEVGAFMAVVVAIILTYMGWIPIPVGFLVTAMFLAILMALIYGKRRLQT